VVGRRVETSGRSFSFFATVSTAKLGRNQGNRADRPGFLRCHIVFWAEIKSQFDQPFFNVCADDIRMVFLQVVQARSKLHKSAILKSLRKTLGRSRRHQGAWISREKEFWVR